MSKSKLLCRWGLGLLVLAVCVPMAMADGPDDQWSMSVAVSMTKPMSMSVDYTGERIGSCTAETPVKGE